jgi:hypothetical protein
MSDDFVVTVKQITSYPFTASANYNDAVLIQQGGVGGPYAWTDPNGLLAPLAAEGGPLGIGRVPPAGAAAEQWFSNYGSIVLDGGIGFNAYVNGGWAYSQAGPAAVITFGNGEIAGVIAPSGISGNAIDMSANQVFVINSAGMEIFNGTLAVARDPVAPNEVATAHYVTSNTVWSLNGRQGNVNLTLADIVLAGGAPIESPHFAGFPTTPDADLSANNNLIANTRFVWSAIYNTLGCTVISVNGRNGNVVINECDLIAANGTTWNHPLVPTQPMADRSNNAASTLFVAQWIDDIQNDLVNFTSTNVTQAWVSQNFAPINSPNFTGIPTGPTANPGNTTGQLATTAFVQAAITGGTAGVASFNTRTGAVTLTTLDITNAGGAPLASPALSGTPTAPTATAGTNTTQIASTAFVHAAVAAIPAPVTSFNTRTGAVTLVLTDVTAVGGAPLAGPTFTGIPSAPTAAPSTNTTQIATTAFVTAAISALPANVTTFNGRSGAVSLIQNDVSAVGGALLASPSFTGAPLAPTASPGTSTTQIATTAFVTSAIAAIATGVTSFNTRTGPVTLTTADVTSAGGAPLASPTFTGVPAGPTASPATNTTQLATTAFVAAAIAAIGTGVTSFNTRTGAVTLSSADVSAAGGALLASPTFTGVPSAPTATAGTNTTQLATTQFVTAAISAINVGVTTFNTRSGAVTLSGTDITGAGGLLSATAASTYLPLAGGTVTGTLTVQPSSGAANVYTVAPAGSSANHYLNVGTSQWDVCNVTGTMQIFDNSGGGGTRAQFTAGSSGIFTIMGDGQKPGGGPWTATSDERIKHVRDIWTGGLNEIIQIHPVVFVYRGNDRVAPDLPSPHKDVAESQKLFVGLSAQSVEMIIPQMVEKTTGWINDCEVDDLRKIDAGPLLYTLVNAVKELAERVSDLERTTHADP